MNKNKKKEKREPIPQPQCCKDTILPDFPCAMSFVGLSKSGKTTLLKNILTDKDLLGGYFHTVLLFSPTSECDTTITAELDMPDENVFTNFTPDDIRRIIDARKKEIKKKGWNKTAKTNRMAIIFDDCIAHRAFLKSKEILDLCATVRHELISVFFLIQSLNMVPRPCRINLRGICFFESNANEVEVLINEARAPSLKKSEMRELIHYATCEPYSFLFINRDSPYRERYRHKLHTILRLK